jgi:signal transduction histidine kinase
VRAAAKQPAPTPSAGLPLVMFVTACLGVLAVLWVADRALLIGPGPSRNGPLRAALWFLGLTALTMAALGVRRERLNTRRIAERSAELERLSEELFQANRSKSEFLANVSHELRTPLNAVVGFAELLQEGVYGELTPRQAGPVQRIAASAAHLRHLVDQILDLAKIAAGRLEVHAELVALRPFVLDVAGEIESLVREKGLTLSIGVPASLPKLRSDPLHVRQVLVNLLGNAVKFTPSGGRVSVRASLVRAPVSAPPFPVRRGHTADALLAAAVAPADGDGAGVRTLAAAVQRLRRRLPVERDGDGPEADWVALQVADTGAGISPDHQARIFDEFEQLGPRTGDGAVRGTGLGLAISRRLAHLLDGELTVESALGEGSTFTLWLPVDPADVRPARRPAQQDRRHGDRRQQDRRTSPDPAPDATVGSPGPGEPIDVPA